MNNFNTLKVSKITNYLFISGEVNQKDFDKLENIGITAIINLIPKYSYDVNNRFAYIHVPFYDSVYISKKKLDKIYDFIEKEKSKKNSKILIHCSLGVSRSPGIVIGQLLLDNPDWTWKDGLLKVRKSKKVYIELLIKLSIIRYIRTRLKETKMNKGII